MVLELLADQCQHAGAMQCFDCLQLAATIFGVRGFRKLLANFDGIQLRKATRLQLELGE